MWAHLVAVRWRFMVWTVFIIHVRLLPPLWIGFCLGLRFTFVHLKHLKISWYQVQVTVFHRRMEQLLFGIKQTAHSTQLCDKKAGCNVSYRIQFQLVFSNFKVPPLPPCNITLNLSTCLCIWWHEPLIPESLYETSERDEHHYEKRCHIKFLGDSHNKTDFATVLQN